MAESREHRTLRTGNPETLKAIAHPLRIEILGILDRDGEHTASQIAEKLGQTVANCSFHLRTLEKHGYIERAPQRGREKPWRTAHDSRNLTPDPEVASSVAQASQVASLYVQRESHRMLQALQQGGSIMQDPEWVLAWTVNTSEFWATAEEMSELARRVTELTKPFEGRGSDPSLRPEGSRRGHLFATVNPDPQGFTDAAVKADAQDDTEAHPSEDGTP